MKKLTKNFFLKQSCPNVNFMDSERDTIISTMESNESKEIVEVHVGIMPKMNLNVISEPCRFIDLLNSYLVLSLHQNYSNFPKRENPETRNFLETFHSNPELIRNARCLIKCQQLEDQIEFLSSPSTKEDLSKTQRFYNKAIELGVIELPLKNQNKTWKSDATKKQNELFQTTQTAMTLASATIAAQFQATFYKLTSYVNPIPETQRFMETFKMETSVIENFANSNYESQLEWFKSAEKQLQSFLETFEKHILSDLTNFFKVLIETERAFFKDSFQKLMDSFPRDWIYSGFIEASNKELAYFMKSMETSHLVSPKSFLLSILNLKDPIFHEILRKTTLQNFKFADATMILVKSKFAQILESTTKLGSYLSWNSEQRKFNFNDLKWYSDWSMQIHSVFNEICERIVSETSGLKALPNYLKDKFESDFREFENLLKRTYLCDEVRENAELAGNIETVIQNLNSELAKQAIEQEICVPITMAVGYDKKATSKFLGKYISSQSLQNGLIIDASGECSMRFRTIEEISRHFGFKSENISKILICFDERDEPDLILNQDSFFYGFNDLVSDTKNKEVLLSSTGNEAWETAINRLRNSRIDQKPDFQEEPNQQLKSVQPDEELVQRNS